MKIVTKMKRKTHNCSQEKLIVAYFYSFFAADWQQRKPLAHHLPLALPMKVKQIVRVGRFQPHRVELKLPIPVGTKMPLYKLCS